MVVAFRNILFLLFLTVYSQLSFCQQNKFGTYYNQTENNLMNPELSHKGLHLTGNVKKE